MLQDKTLDEGLRRIGFPENEGLAPSRRATHPPRIIRDAKRWLDQCRLPTAPGDAPDRAVAVFADEERAVLGDGDADRAGPDGSIVDHEAGQKILVFAGRLATLQQYADDLVAGALGAVPGAVERGEDVAA